MNKFLTSTVMPKNRLLSSTFIDCWLHCNTGKKQRKHWRRTEGKCCCRCFSFCVISSSRYLSSSCYLSLLRSSSFPSPQRVFADVESVCCGCGWNIPSTPELRHTTQTVSRHRININQEGRQKKENKFEEVTARDWSQGKDLQRTEEEEIFSKPPFALISISVFCFAPVLFLCCNCCCCCSSIDHSD